MITIEDLSNRADLAELATRWGWEEWGHKSGLFDTVDAAANADAALARAKMKT